MAEKMQICPWCSNGNPIGTQFCHSCRRKLFEYDKQSPTPNQYQQQQPPSNQPHPTAQKIRYEPTTHSCPYCGSRLWWADRYQSYYCAQCKKYISPQRPPVYQVYPQPLQPIIVQHQKSPHLYQQPGIRPSSKKDEKIKDYITIGTIITVVFIVVLFTYAVLVPAFTYSFDTNPSDIDPIDFDPSDEDTYPFEPTGHIQCDYSWDYGGYEWTLHMSISRASYYEYKSMTRTSNYGLYVTDNDPDIEELADAFKQQAESKGYNDYETVSFIMAFVQSLPYTSDSVTTGYNEYPRYPVETLVDNGGDCEDTSILFAALLQSYPLNYDAVLFEIPADLPTHVAVGIWGEDEVGHYYYTYQDRNYYYCETTGNGWKIGEKPSEYIGDYARVIQV